MKKCSKCGSEKVLEEFPWKIKAKNLKASICNICMATYAKSHYYRNKKQYFVRNRNQKARIYAHLRGLKESPCTDCGVAYPYYVMQFDHVTVGRKPRHVATLTNSYRGLLRELEHCNLVCSNCHEKRTWQRRVMSGYRF